MRFFMKNQFVKKLLNLVLSITRTYLHNNLPQQRGEIKRKIIQQLQDNHGSAKTLRANLMSHDQTYINSLEAIRQKLRKLNSKRKLKISQSGSTRFAHEKSDHHMKKKLIYMIK